MRQICGSRKTKGATFSCNPLILLVGANRFEQATTRTLSAIKYTIYLILLCFSCPNLPIFALFIIIFPTFFRHGKCLPFTTHISTHFATFSVIGHLILPPTLCNVYYQIDSINGNRPTPSLMYRHIHSMLRTLGVSPYFLKSLVSLSGR